MGTAGWLRAALVQDCTGCGASASGWFYDNIKGLVQKNNAVVHHLYLAFALVYSLLWWKKWLWLTQGNCFHLTALLSATREKCLKFTSITGINDLSVCAGLRPQLQGGNDSGQQAQKVKQVKAACICSCWFSAVSNQSPQSDLWLLTSTRYFPPHNCCCTLDVVSIWDRSL